MVLCPSILCDKSFFLVELLIEKLLPLTIVLLRVGIAATTLWAILRILRLPFVLFFGFLRRAGTTNAAIVTLLIPV